MPTPPMSKYTEQVATEGAKLIFQDDFSNGVTWTGLTLSGTPNIPPTGIAADTAHVLVGAKSMKLTLDTGAAGAQYGLVKFLPFYGKKIYYEVCLAINKSARDVLVADGYLYFPNIAENKAWANRREGQVTCKNLQQWFLTKSDSSLLDISSLITNKYLGYTSEDARGSVWNRIGLGVDIDNIKYDFLLVNDEIIDLSAYALKNSSLNYDATNLHCNPSVYIGANKSVAIWYDAYRMFQYTDREALFALLRFAW